MLPIVTIFLVFVLLIVAGCLVFMFVNVLRDGPPDRSHFDDRLRWRPPIASGPELKAWAAKMTESVTQKLLSQRRTKSTPTRLAEEVLSGASFAVQHLPHLATNADQGRCPNRDVGQLGVTAPEVLAIADKLRVNPVEVNRVRDLTVKNMRLLAESDSHTKESPTLVCPLLTSEGDCAACGLRPVHCRTKCHLCGLLPQADAETLEEAARQLGAGVEVGLSRGLNAAGLAGNLYELNSALAVALESPDASERWSHGEDVFGECTRYEYSAHAV
jgi:hypothetical protein